MRALVASVILSSTAAASPPDAGADAGAPSKCAATKTPYVPGIRFASEVNDDAVKEFSAALDKIELSGMPDAVVVAVDSPGGEIPAGLQMTHVMEDRPYPIVCVVDGRAESMALVVLQGCDVRLATKRAAFLIHHAMLNAGMDNAIGLESDAARLRALDEAMFQSLAAKSKVTVKELYRRTDAGREWWFAWKDAERLGFVDGIVDSVPSVVKSLKAAAESAR